MAILRASALYAPTYDKKLQKMLDRDFGTANFPTKVRAGGQGGSQALAASAAHLPASWPQRT